MAENHDSIYRFTFLRHGESIGNRENRFQGHADFPLTDIGFSQAHTLAKQWNDKGKSFDKAVSSPLLRARQTAEIICTTLDVPLAFDSNWKEIDNGLIAGLKPEEAENVIPKPSFMTPFTHFGGTGESRWELFLRAGRALQYLLDQPAGSTLVVAHGGILNMTFYAILGIPLQANFSGPRFMIGNTAYADFIYEPKQHNWHMLSFIGHPNGKDSWA